MLIFDRQDRLEGLRGIEGVYLPWEQATTNKTEIPSEAKS